VAACQLKSTTPATPRPPSLDTRPREGRPGTGDDGLASVAETLAGLTAAARSGGLDDTAALSALAAARGLAAELERSELALIEAARDGGATWSRIATAMDARNRQTAQKRHADLAEIDQIMAAAVPAAPPPKAWHEHHLARSAAAHFGTFPAQPGAGIGASPGRSRHRRVRGDRRPGQGKLLPGLFHLAAADLMPDRYQIIGSSRRSLADGSQDRRRIGPGPVAGHVGFATRLQQSPGAGFRPAWDRR
jgi:hypothetical protein